MADGAWEETTLRCASCSTTAATESYSVDGSGKVTVPPSGWMVADPGTDEGPLFVCSRACAEAWSAKDAAAWQRASQKTR